MVRRWLHRGFIVSLVIFCLGTAVVGGMGIGGNRSGRFFQLFGPWDCTAGITRMGVQIVVWHGWREPVVGPVADASVSRRASQIMSFENQFPHTRVWRGPFAYEHGIAPVIKNGRIEAVGTRTWVMFPYRLFAGVFLVLPGVRWVVVPLVRRVRAVRRRGGCVKCGYDLTGNVSGVCPECGRDSAPNLDLLTGGLRFGSRRRSVNTAPSLPSPGVPVEGKQRPSPIRLAARGWSGNTAPSVPSPGVTGVMVEGKQRRVG